MPKEEGDVIREHKAVHEENFLSSWLREEGKVKEGKLMEMNAETKDVTSQKQNKRRGERRERDFEG